MTDECCTLRQLLENAPGAEEHAQTCPACRELLAIVNRYQETFQRESPGYRKIMDRVREEQGAAGTVEHLEAVPAAERRDWIMTHDCASFALALKLAVKGRSVIYHSPRQTDEWLQLAYETYNFSRKKPAAHPKDEPFTKARLLTIQGSLSVMRGHVDAAHDNYLRARELHEQLGGEYEAALIVEGLAQTFTLIGQPQEAVTLCLQTLPILREYGARRFYLRLFKNLSAVLYAQGKIVRALKISTLIVNVQDVDEESRLTHLRNHALILYALQRFDEAEAIAQKLLVLSNAQDSTMEAARSHWLLGELATDRERYPEAAEHILKARQVFKEEGDLLDEALCNAQLARVELLQGHAAKAGEILATVCDYLRREGIHYHLEIQLRAWLDSMQAGNERVLPLARASSKAIHALLSPYKSHPSAP